MKISDGDGSSITALALEAGNQIAFFKTQVRKLLMNLICCIQGEVWVTQERDIHDYILDAGESFLITLPGLVLVRALKASRIGYIKSLNQARFHGRFGHTVFK